MEPVSFSHVVDAREKLSQKEKELESYEKRLALVKMLYYKLRVLLYKNGGSIYAGRIRYSGNYEIDTDFYFVMMKLKAFQEKYDDFKKECRDLYGPAKAKVVYL